MIVSPAMDYISDALEKSNEYYITALNFKYCYLSFDDLLMLGTGMRLNRTLVKLDLSKNALKSKTLGGLNHAYPSSSGTGAKNLI